MTVISSNTECCGILPQRIVGYKKKKPNWTSFGGDNKTRTYDLYDVNVAL